MAQDHKIISALRNELDIPALLGEKLNPREVKGRVFKDFAPYFENPQQLKFALEHNLLLYEYGFFLKMRDVRWFVNLLHELLLIFRKAKDTNPTKCFETIAKHHSALGDAQHNGMQAFRLEEDKNKERLDLLAKLCFRELGDMIEGSLQPYLLLVLDLYRMSRGKAKPNARMAEITLGEAVAELLSSGQFDDAYQPSPWKIRINQWRNIAQHNSYKANNASGLVNCSYGKSKKLRTVTLDRSALLELAVRVHDIIYTHKLAVTLFFDDHVQSISRFMPDVASIEITDDTKESHVYALLYGNGFQVASLENTDSGWTLIAIDTQSRSNPARLEDLNVAISVFKYFFPTKDIKLTVTDADGSRPLTVTAADESTT